jgi:hypothetical protein
VEAALNLQGQYVPAPTVLDSLADVPFPISRPLNPVKQYAVVKPGNLCSNLLHNCPIRPGGGEGTHIFQVPGRQPLHVGEGFAEVSRQLIYDARGPGLNAPHFARFFASFSSFRLMGRKRAQ